MARIFHVTFGETSYEIPQLTFRAEQAWSEQVATALKEVAPHVDILQLAKHLNLEKPDEVVDLINQITDLFNGSMATIGDLVINYLPEKLRAEVEERAYRDELILALVEMVKRSIPLAALAGLGSAIGLTNPVSAMTSGSNASSLAVVPRNDTTPS